MMKTKRLRRKGTPLISGRREYRLVPDKKEIKTIIGFMIALIALEAAFALCLIYGCDYGKREARADNTRTVTLTDPRAKYRYKGSSSIIGIYGGGEEYKFVYIRAVGMNRAELVDAMNDESVLHLTVEDDNWVCAISGEKSKYLSLEDYNVYQKKQCVIGKWLCGSLAVLTFVTLGAVIFVKLRDKDYYKKERVR